MPLILFVVGVISSILRFQEPVMLCVMSILYKNFFMYLIAKYQSMFMQKADHYILDRYYNKPSDKYIPNDNRL